MKKSLLGLGRAELSLLVAELGEKPYRGKQVADWLYHRGAREFKQMDNLPAVLRSKLGNGYSVGRSVIGRMDKSTDDTFKLLLRLADGEMIETVGMLYEDRFTCCVSTQVGCAMGCLFCATGASGFKRNLTAGEIVDQVITAGEIAAERKLLKNGDRVSHVVFMGMGEPLLNYDATLSAVRLLNSELNIGMRNITVSTIGYIPGMYRLAKEHLQITLAVSLHATSDDLRKRLIPGMSRYKLNEIIEASRDYIRETGRRITFEYCLLQGVNDGQADAARLVALLKGLNCHVNLIPFNTVEGCGFKCPYSSQVAAFRRVLEQGGLAVTQREQKGANINAACGQLRRQTVQMND